MTIPTQFNATSLFSPSGKISSSFAFVSDLTKQKKVLEHLQQAREEADRANALKGDFLANMSHEIRTPMNAIIGLLHLLQSSDMDVRQQGYIRQIQCSADSLLGIINDIMPLTIRPPLKRGYTLFLTLPPPFHPIIRGIRCVWGRF
jgi:signal transduction histidine kinase